MSKKSVARVAARAERCRRLENSAPVAPASDSSKAIRAEISGDNRCKALGIVASSATPVLMLCRKLVETGVDPARALEAWRGPILCLRIRSIGEAARLRINGVGTGFCPDAVKVIAPPMRQTAQAVPIQPPTLRSAPARLFAPKIEKHAAPSIAPRFAMPIRNAALVRR